MENDHNSDFKFVENANNNFLGLQVGYGITKRFTAEIEAGYYLNRTQNFKLNDKKIVKIVKIPSKKYTINYILKETQQRIGDHKFFNWSICKNNCYVFIKEILVTINLFNKSNKNFINQDKFVKSLQFSKFTLHILNFFIALNNVLENYLII